MLNNFIVEHFEVDFSPLLHLVWDLKITCAAGMESLDFLIQSLNNRSNRETRIASFSVFYHKECPYHYD